VRSCTGNASEQVKGTSELDSEPVMAKLKADNIRMVERYRYGTYMFRKGQPY